LENTGWWTYAFCHNRYVKQFHALPPGNNVPHYPPVQDPSTESFILGQTPAYERHQDTEIYGQPPSQLDEGLTSVDALGEQRYLVQKMGGGTWCDLIKKNRRIEVQFQCDPNGGDRIEWIKETTTCSYLMVIHTAKLCNDLAFVPVKRVGEGEGIHEILCLQVLAQEEIEAGSVFPEGSGQQVFELPPGTKVVEGVKGPASVETTTTEENPEAADYLEFILPPASLPSAAKLLQETILSQIKEGSFLRPDGEPYDPESEDVIEYRVELIDDEEGTVFGVIKVKISQGAVVETEFYLNADDGEQGKDVLPESLRKELNDWLQGRDMGPPENP
jgi:Glucosidase II beta subunit-like protein